MAGVLLAADGAVLAALTAVGMPLLAAKVTAEVALVGASYLAQRSVVFACRAADRPRADERVPEPVG